MMTFYAGVMTGILLGLLIACVAGYIGCCVLERNGYSLIKFVNGHKTKNNEK